MVYALGSLIYILRYIITHEPDIVSLQEAGLEVPVLRGYVSYVLSCGDGRVKIH